MYHPWEEVYRLQFFLRRLLIDPLSKRFSAPCLGAVEVRQDKEFSGPIQAPQTIEIYEIAEDLATARVSWTRCPLTLIDSGLKNSAKINVQDFSLVGDIRYIAVKNRLLILPHLALADLCLGTDTSLEVIEEWFVQNPYLESVNWCSGIEIAIRCVQILQVVTILARDSDASRELVGRSLQYLESHLSRYSSANNHLLAELLALIYILRLYPTAKSKKSLGYYCEYFEEEFRRQTHFDGFCKEQSLHYHSESLEYAATYLGLNHSEECSQDFLMAVKQAGSCLDVFLGYDGNAPLIGDSDEGKMLGLSNSMLEHYGHLLAYLSFFTGVEYTNQLELSKGDDFRLPMTSKAATRNLQVLHKIPREKVYVHSGYYVAQSATYKFIFDFGGLGLEPLCAHGHSDAFSFICSVRGMPVIIDSGTFQYHERFAAKRDYYRSGSAHSSFLPEGIDFADPAGRMQWKDGYRIVPTAILNQGEQTVIRARTTSAALQKNGLDHFCEFTADETRRHFKIFHRYSGETQAHSFVWRMPLDSSITVTYSGKHELMLSNENGPCLRISSPELGQYNVENATRSVSFGSEQGAKLLVFRVPGPESMLQIQLL